MGCDLESTAAYPAHDDVLADYWAALKEAAFYIHPDGGYLRIEGPDRVDFLQRQTTNDLRRLTAGLALSTVLTSATARILDVLVLIAADDGLEAVTLPGRAAATALFLQSRIFFMDKVAVKDTSHEVAQFLLMGPQAPAILHALGADRVPDVSQVAQTELGGLPVWIIGGGGFSGPAYLLLVPQQLSGPINDSLVLQGAKRLSSENYDVLRIESGQPGPAHELTEDYTPLEMNLASAISGTKGCYTGQEVIARQLAYDKVTKRLVGLRLAERVEPGAEVRVGKRNQGRITSVAISPRFGAIALAVLKRPYYREGVEVVVASPGGVIEGTVQALPFG